MATVVLQYAGQAVGTLFGGPIGGLIGRALGAVAGNIIDQSLFGAGTRKIEGPRLSDLRVMASTEGAPVPRLWGRMRVAGQVIWSTSFEEVTETRTEKDSAKGSAPSAKITEYNYFANFAVALCEGEIDRIGRVWADGKDLDISEYTTRLYRGTEDQLPDSLIIAKEGTEQAPAYRGIAYVVFERLPVNDFGNRLPQLSFEVFRSAQGAGQHVRAVNIIPGSTEFGYDTDLITRDAGDGVTESENAHASAVKSDWTVSLDHLTASCPAAEAAALVVAWFGDDLRCAHTRLRPGVEALGKVTDPAMWSVNGVSRAGAHVVSTSGGGPAFGGTPSDSAVIHAIEDLTARGLKTVFYPFILMDVPESNGLPDPYGAAEQGAYPWRGRITCDPAPGRATTPDKTAAAAVQVAALVGTAQSSDFTVNGTSVSYTGPAEWSYRRMVLHYAHVCAAAGGVDAFLIGSELRGLTAVRGTANSFPFVAALVQLAADVKAILPDAQVSYAADWSEYFGHQPNDGTGDVFFHLDPLWSSPNVSFVGIDNYMPLSDWRDGEQHLDRMAGHPSIHGAAYLQANIAAGEGFDWYYAGDVARGAQVRTPITDGAYGKPWVFRYKDLKSWWLNAHFDRPGGIEAATATAWVPQSKPIWFTEAGCPAIDKGTNQPNAFVDAKSSENLLPYFSSGRRDDLIQHRYITALATYWQAGGSHNPVSAVYDGTMVDAARIFFWSWDARPYPWFPARTDIWADGVNYTRGHWLNGRIDAVPLAGLIAAVCAGYGVDGVVTEGLDALVDGFLIDRPMSARDALEGIAAAFAIDAVESAGQLTFRMRNAAAVMDVDESSLVETAVDVALFAITRGQESELSATLTLSYLESGFDYRRAAVTAQRLNASLRRDAFIELPCAIEQAPALVRAEIGLQESWASRDRAELGLPRSRLSAEPGDVVVLDLPSGPLQFRIDEIADGGFRKVRARSFDRSVYTAPDTPDRGLSASLPPVFGKPDAMMMNLPVASATTAPHAPWLAASASPWPGRLAVYRQASDTTYDFNRAIDAQATKGRLVQPLAAGPSNIFDRGTTIDVKLESGALAAVSERQMLGGANAAAIGSDGDGFEIIQFATAELIAANTYRLSTLLRGQSGSEPECLPSRPSGSRFVLLNGAVVQPDFALSDARQTITWRIGPARYDPARAHVSFDHEGTMLGLRPWAPCHARARRDAGDVVFTWIRRTRVDGDNWELDEVPLAEDREAYRLDIMDGAEVRRTVQVETPQYRYTAADMTADFGTAPASFSLRIGQISATFGRGALLERIIHV